MPRIPIPNRRVNIITFLLGGFVGSELMWIIGTDNKRKDFDRKFDAEIAATEQVLLKLRRGEKVDIGKELVVADESKDRSVEDILSSLEAMDNKWADPAPILKQPKPASETGKWM